MDNGSRPQPDASTERSERRNLVTNLQDSSYTIGRLDGTWRDTKNVISYNARMSGGKTYYVYIMTNQSRTLYIGVTNNIKQRVYQHKTGVVEGFTHHYKINLLVYVETFSDVNSAIAREKQIKRWRREKKLQLIERDNPDWQDLSDGW